MHKQLLLWRYKQGHRNFTGINLVNTNLRKARLAFSVLNQANLRLANLSQAHLVGADLVYANLRHARLIETNLIGANLLAADLHGADLSRSRLCGALLNAVDGSSATLNHASLAGADLRGANLQGASLRHANLRDANLKAANLLDADLTGANLEGADLLGAILPDASEYSALLDSVAPRCETTAIQDDEEPTITILPAELQAPGTQTNPFAGAGAGGFENQTFQNNDVVLIANTAEDGAECRAIDREWGFSQGGTSRTDGTEQTRESTVFEISQLFEPQTFEEAQGRLRRSILFRKGEVNLRRRLLQAYDERCAITRSRVVEVLEVTYILPFAEEQTNQPGNALLLQSDLHLLFDLHLITIDPQTLTVKVAPTLMDSYYRTLVGRSLYLPVAKEYQPNLEFLALHHNACAWLQEQSAWSEAYAF